jgi:signal transduction histidine kinase
MNDKMPKSKYDKYIAREPIFKYTKFRYSNVPEVRLYGGNYHHTLISSKFPIEQNIVCITEPCVMSKKHVHDFDEVIVFVGSNPSNFAEFKAEVEIFLGEESEKHIIDTTATIYIPRGLAHCPIKIVRLSRPIIFIYTSVSPQHNVSLSDMINYSTVHKRYKPDEIEFLKSAYISLQQQIAIREKSEGELVKSREQLRDFSAHLQSIREEERAVIAREIHDELGQALTALSLDMSWLYSRLPDDQELLLEKLKSMSGIIDSTVKTVKRISAELRPNLLDDLGIVAALEWQVNKFQDNTGIKCEIQSNPSEINLNKKQSTAIFRIFQEALTNIARHANATRLKASLNQINHKIELKVKDNGIGITKEQISAYESLGLLGMRERAYSLGGDLNIKGIKGKGTTVTVTVPLELESKGNK